VAIVLTVVVFLAETVRAKTALQWRTPFTLPVVLFLVAGAISVVVAPSHRAALGIYRAYLIEPIAFFFVVSTVVRTVRQADVVLIGLGVAALGLGIPNGINTIYAALHHQLNLCCSPPVIIYTAANAVALFLIPLEGVAASLLFFSRDRRERLWAGLFLLVIVPVTLLTFSRGGYLTLAAVAIALAAVSGYRLWLVPAIVVAGGLFSRTPPIAARLAHESLTDPSNTISDRLKIWGESLRMLRHYPIFGAGLSGFATRVIPFRNGFLQDHIYAHNIALDFWSETGLLGLAAFTWLFVRGLVMGWRGWRKGSPEWRPLHLGVALAFLAILAHGLVDNPYWKNAVSYTHLTLPTKA